MSTRKVARPGVSRGSELLDEWCRGMSKWQAALALSIDYGAVCSFITGNRRPGTQRAQQIELKTNGAVPVVAWEQKASRSFTRRHAA